MVLRKSPMRNPQSDRQGCVGFLMFLSFFIVRGFCRRIHLWPFQSFHVNNASLLLHITCGNLAPFLFLFLFHFFLFLFCKITPPTQSRQKAKKKWRTNSTYQLLFLRLFFHLRSFLYRTQQHHFHQKYICCMSPIRNALGVGV